MVSVAGGNAGKLEVVKVLLIEEHEKTQPVLTGV